ncbi:hypothetical protein ABPG74_007817 [Tetrahymena malaccensis]
MDKEYLSYSQRIEYEQFQLENDINQIQIQTQGDTKTVNTNDDDNNNKINFNALPVNFQNKQKSEQNQPQKNIFYQKKKECQGFEPNFWFLVLALSVSSTFGVLFNIFYRNSDYNDYCDNKPLKRWTCALSVLFLINSCIVFLKFIGFFYDKRCVYLFRAQLLVVLCMFVCYIGIQIIYTGDCGQLSKVSLAFMIIFSVFIADNTGILLFIVFRIIIG